MITLRKMQPEKGLVRLHERSWENDTIIFFLSDNGGATKDNAASNLPLRESTNSHYEGGWRIPFAVQWPGKIPAGKDYDHPVSSLDIFTTLAAMVGARPDPQRPLGGVNRLPHLSGRISAPPHAAIYLRMYDRGSYAARRGDYKLVIPGDYRHRRRGNLREPKLYDLSPELGETRNLAKAHPEIVRQLEELRVRWDTELMAPTFPGRQRPGAQTEANPSTQP